MDRTDLVRWLDNYLQTASFRDASLNGLQVEGKGEVNKIGIAVDAAGAIFTKAAAQNVDFLITHHGLFWGAPFAITGYQKKRIETLFSSEMSLYCSHIPLDAHVEVGNNAVLLRELGLTYVEPFLDPKYGPLGHIGRFEIPVPLEQVVAKLSNLTGTPPVVHGFGKADAKRVCIISGDAVNRLSEVEAAGCDLFITGETSHPQYHDALERGINVICAGHYLTETWGVKALAEKIQAEFGLPFVFIDHPTGI